MPLMFDMPLEKLYEYQGRNPRPEDHESFWDRGLAEMQAIDPQVELVPASFQVPFAECFHLYFTGVAGARAAGMFSVLYDPNEEHPAPDCADIRPHLVVSDWSELVARLEEAR